MRDFLEVMQEGQALEASLGQRAGRISNFNEKLVKFIELIANKNGLPKNLRQYMLKETESTSDFPILFGTVLDRQLLDAYKIQKPAYRNYIKTGTQADFRPSNLIATYGLQSAMDVVPELGEYKAAKLQDGKVQCTLTKYGRTFPLSWEALVNDDLNAFGDIASKLVNAALRTEYRVATGLICDAAGPLATLFGDALAHPIDKATIDNKDTLALTAANLFTTITRMRNQKDVDGEPIIIDGFELVVPPSLEKAALEAVNPAALIATGVGASAATQTSANVTAQLNIRINVNPYLEIVNTSGSKSTTWYVFATLSNGQAIQVNFLTGHENPEVVQKASDKVSLGGGEVSALEGNFQNDSMIWRVRHILGGTIVDPRMAYANVG